MITGFPSLETAIQALKIGADDYITKPFNVNDMKYKIERAVESLRLKREVALLQDVVSIYESAKFLSATLSQEEILFEIYKKLVEELGMSGFYVKLFSRKLTFQHADRKIIDFIDGEFNAKKVLIIFKKMNIFEFSIDDYLCFLFPMYAKNGLFGIFCTLL